MVAFNLHASEIGDAGYTRRFTLYYRTLANFYISNLHVDHQVF